MSNNDSSQEYTFQPEFCHQLFGQSENIFGYKNLRVILYYTASKLNRCISINYSDKVSEEMSQGVPPDDIFQIINEKLQGQMLTNIDQFSSHLNHDRDFKPYGTLNDSFKINYKVSLLVKFSKLNMFLHLFLLPKFSLKITMSQKGVLKYFAVKWIIQAASKSIMQKCRHF
jgi:hypothetical protein